MKQMVIRTCSDPNYDNTRTLNIYLSDGWSVVLVNTIGRYLEYILQKDE